MDFPGGVGEANRDSVMKDTSLRNHLTIVGQLPDFVLGKLDETSVRRVARHLEDCPVCQREATNAMVALGTLADVPPPAATVRSEILRRADATRPAASGPAPAADDAWAVSDESRGITRFPGWSRRTRWRWDQSVHGKAVAAAVVVLVSGLLGWSYEQRAPTLQQDRVDAMMDEQVVAYPLDDSDLPVSAAGVVFAGPASREVYLVANGLPVLPHDQRYQVWLFTDDDKQESAGLVTVEPDGDLRAYLQIPEPFADYVGVALTAEPMGGSAVPTSDLVLGGSFPPVIAAMGATSA
jgi:anti-sigma-K factor RskA